MIAVIHTAGEKRGGITVSRHLHPCIGQFLEEGFGELDAANGVIHKSDRDACPGLLDQNLLDACPDMISPENIIFHMNMMLCLPQLQQQGAECFFAVGQNPRFRTEGNRCPGQPL
ncbi:hypothetical protein D3C81_1723810 [compost metagenome]